MKHFSHILATSTNVISGRIDVDSANFFCSFFRSSPLTRQKRTSSSGCLNKLAISDPMDFRHIQHGFSSRPVSIAL